MKRFFTSLLLLVGVAILGADQPDNGIYLRIREETAQSAMSQDGQKIYIGKKQELKWFAFDKAGIYVIHGSYYLAFTDPGAKSCKTIWEDYVSADFTVHIIE